MCHNSSYQLLDVVSNVYIYIHCLNVLYIPLYRRAKIVVLLRLEAFWLELILEVQLKYMVDATATLAALPAPVVVLVGMGEQH